MTRLGRPVLSVSFFLLSLIFLHVQNALLVFCFVFSVLFIVVVVFVCRRFLLLIITMILVTPVVVIIIMI